MSVQPLTTNNQPPTNTLLLLQIELPILKNWDNNDGKLLFLSIQIL
ncbi:hypothetical protein [Fischerella sp. JS2]|nr:hypothetical protein [Fischerella sp. JS2]